MKKGPGQPNNRNRNGPAGDELEITRYFLGVDGCGCLY